LHGVVSALNTRHDFDLKCDATNIDAINEIKNLKIWIEQSKRKKWEWKEKQTWDPKAEPGEFETIDESVNREKSLDEISESVKNE
jgi:hypothetical protein